MKCKYNDNNNARYYCIPCDSEVCSDCAIDLHNKSSRCNIINIAGIPAEVSKLQRKLKKELDSVKGSTWSPEEYTRVKRVAHKNLGDIRSKIKRDSFTLSRNISENKRAMIEKVYNQELAEKNETRSMKEDLSILKEELERLHKLTEHISKDELIDLQKILNGRKQVRDAQTSLTKHLDLLHTKKNSLLFCGIHNDGTFGVVTRSFIIGTTVLGPSHLIHIYDKRSINEDVYLVCTDINDTKKDISCFMVKVENQSHPVVMSNMCLVSNGKSHILFAVGNVVFIVSLHALGSQYDSIESVSTLVIEEVPEHCWITNINAHLSKNLLEDEFIISHNGDFVLRLFNTSGDLIRKIDISKYISNPIRQVSSFATILAIITQGLEEVLIVYDKSSAQPCRILKPKTPLKGMLPTSIVWTTAEFLVLYTSENAGKAWKVISYSIFPEGVITEKECAKGESTTEMDAPVSISAGIKHGYLTFPNGTVQNIIYPNLIDTLGSNLESLSSIFGKFSA